MLFAVLSARDDDQVVLPLQLWWDTHVLQAWSFSLIIVAQISLVDHLGTSLLVVESSLLHHDIKGCDILLRELNGWQGKILINH